MESRNHNNRIKIRISCYGDHRTDQRRISERHGWFRDTHPHRLSSSQDHTTETPGSWCLVLGRTPMHDMPRSKHPKDQQMGRLSCQPLARSPFQGGQARSPATSEGDPRPGTLSRKSHTRGRLASRYPPASGLRPSAVPLERGTHPTSGVWSLYASTSLSAL